MKFANILKIARRFEKFAVYRGYNYIQQKPDGSLYLGGVPVDRAALDNLENWQDLVDLGVDRNIVGRIALTYGGEPRHVAQWLSHNSVPYPDEPEEHESAEISLNVSRGARGRFPAFTFGDYHVSVQGSEGAYSEPREDLDSLDEYEEVEVAVIYMGDLMDFYTGDYSSRHVNSNDPDVMELRDMPHMEYWQDEGNVGPYIPIEKAKDILRYFADKFGS